MVKIRSVRAVPMATQIAIFQTPRADQNPDIFHVVGTGPVGTGDQNLIVAADVAKLAL